MRRFTIICASLLCSETSFAGDFIVQETFSDSQIPVWNSTNDTALIENGVLSMQSGWDFDVDLKRPVNAITLDSVWIGNWGARGVTGFQFDLKYDQQLWGQEISIVVGLSSNQAGLTFNSVVITQLPHGQWHTFEFLIDPLWAFQEASDNGWNLTFFPNWTSILSDINQVTIFLNTTTTQQSPFSFDNITLVPAPGTLILFTGSALLLRRRR